MSLLLKPVEAARGARWMRDAFSLFARRPLAFTMLFVAFLLAALIAQLIPFIGGVLQMMLLPLLSLGFMIASQSALLGGRVSAAQFIEPLQGDKRRRNTLLLLCLIYGLSAVGILLLCNLISDDAMQRLQAQLAKGDSGSNQEVDAILAEPEVSAAALIGATLATLLSIPYWHAPALVYWGGQGVAQALFSSTLAVWRSKGAFLVYTLSWVGVIFGFGVVAAILVGLFDARQLGSILALPAGLMFSTVFYVSLLFTFNDSFGNGQVPPPVPVPAPPEA